MLFTKVEYTQMNSPQVEGKSVISPSLPNSFIFLRLSQKAPFYEQGIQYPEFGDLLIRIEVLMKFIKTQ